jgi:hypothetical protein
MRRARRSPDDHCDHRPTRSIRGEVISTSCIAPRPHPFRKAKPYILALDADDVLLCGSMLALDSAYNHHYDGKIVFGAECRLMYKMAQWNTTR